MQAPQYPSSTTTYTIVGTESNLSSSSSTSPAPIVQDDSFEKYRDIGQNLVNILIKHEKCDDFLSLRLHKKGAKLVQLPSSLDIPNALEKIMYKLDSLKAVLRDPIGTSTLNEPWLVNGGLVWEKCALDRYRQCVSSVSDIAIEAVPHEFAKEMLTWIKNLNFSSSSSSSSSSISELIAAPVTKVNALGMVVVVRPKVPDHNPLAMLAHLDNTETLDAATAFREMKLFNSLVEYAAKEQETYLIKKELKAQKKILAESLLDIKTQRERQLVKFEEDSRSRTAELQKTLDTICESYRASKEIIIQKQEATEKTLAETKKALSHSQAELENQAARVSYLARRVNDLQSQVNNMRDSDGGCAIL